MKEKILQLLKSYHLGEWNDDGEKITYIPIDDDTLDSIVSDILILMGE